MTENTYRRCHLINVKIGFFDFVVLARGKEREREKDNRNHFYRNRFGSL